MSRSGCAQNNRQMLDESYNNHAEFAQKMREGRDLSLKGRAAFAADAVDFSLPLVRGMAVVGPLLPPDVHLFC